MNLQLAFKIVQATAIALTVVNRILIIVENSQKPKPHKDMTDVRGGTVSTPHGTPDDPSA